MAAPEDLVEEELGGTPGAGTRAAAGDGPEPPSGRRVARFAIGVSLLLVCVILLGVGLTGDLYVVQFRDGPEPSGEDNSLTHRHVFGAFDWSDEHIDSDGDRIDLTESEYSDAPYTAVAMKKLRMTGLGGMGLIVLALLAAVLHRFGALTLPGPAPVMAAFGTVLVAAGLVPFITDIVDLTRFDVVPGTLDLTPQFFTQNADGTVLHDLSTRPGWGFWLYLGGAVLLPVAAAFTFWGEFQGLRRKARSLAEEAAADWD